MKASSVIHVFRRLGDIFMLLSCTIDRQYIPRLIYKWQAEVIKIMWVYQRTRKSHGCKVFQDVNNVKSNLFDCTLSYVNFMAYDSSDFKVWRGLGGILQVISHWINKCQNFNNAWDFFGLDLSFLH